MQVIRVAPGWAHVATTAVAMNAVWLLDMGVFGMGRPERLLSPDSQPPGLLVAALDRSVEVAVRAVVPPGRPAALINFPDHGNPGDPAVWLGAERVLARMHVPIVYRASWGSFDPAALRRRVGDGPVLIGGGGNLGDVYINQQRTRERVLRELPDNPVVQLPQSLWFRDRAKAAHFAGLARSHGGFRLLVREESSCRMAADLGLEPVLCPDLSIALGPLRRPVPPSVDVLALLRADLEAAGPPLLPRPGEPVEVVDWLGAVPHEPRRPRSFAALLRFDRWLTPRVAAGGISARAWPALAATYGPLARYWVWRGCAILARGRVVVTDRLHGHLLALLLGIPHVVLDNANGKVRSTYQTWTSPSPLVHWADDRAGALRRAIELAGACDRGREEVAG